MLPSLSPLQIARVKPTAALRPPPASKSFPPAGENPERIFLEIIFSRDRQPRAGHKHGARHQNQLGRTAHQTSREKENHDGCQTPLPGRAAPRHCRLCRAGTRPAQLLIQLCLCLPCPPCSDQSLLLVSQARSRWCASLQAFTTRQTRRALPLQTGAAILAGSSCAEPTAPPPEWCCTTTRCSSSFPFFSHVYLAPPDEPRLPACRSRARRLTRFFQSPRLVLGPAAQDFASSCPGRPVRQQQLLPQRRGEQ